MHKLLLVFLTVSLPFMGCGRNSESPKKGPSAEDGRPYQGVGPGMGEKDSAFGGQGAAADSGGAAASPGKTR